MSSRYDPARRYCRSERERLTRTWLADAARGEAGAARTQVLDDVILLNRCVGESIARRYRGRGIALEDLTQVAYEGLTKAARRFRPGKHDFLTYAVPTITGEVRRHFRDHGWAVRPPRRLQELQYRINTVTTELAQRLGRDPGRTDLITALGIDGAEYDEAMAAYGSFAPVSLDAPGPGSPDGGTPRTPAALIAEDRAISAAEARILLAPLVRRMSAPDRRLLHLRFVHDLSQAEIGQQFGVTQMQISRRLKRTLEHLRAELTSAPTGRRGGEPR